MAEIRAEKARLETRPLAQHLANRAGEVQYVNQTLEGDRLPIYACGENRYSIRKDGQLAVNCSFSFMCWLSWGGETQISRPAQLPGPRPPFRSSSPLDRPKLDLKPTFPPPGFVAPTHLCFSHRSQQL